MQGIKYKPGDKILVRSDLKQDEYYSMRNGQILIVNGDMYRNYAGRVLTIKRCTAYAYYNVEENIWCWTDDMFVGVIGEETDESKVKSFYDFVM